MSNLLAELLKRGKAIWAAMAVGHRIALLSFLGMMSAMLVALALWSSQTEYVMLYGGLSAEDAAAMGTKLKDEKIAFRYEVSRGAIMVLPAQADSARLLLAGQGLPKSSTEGFELFDKASFGTTEFVQRVNYIRALQGSLARSIQTIDAVESARVSLTIPEEEVFARDKREAKASVVLRLRAGRRLGNEQISAIRHLVAASVPKLETGKVTIVDSTGRMLSRLQDSGDMGALTEEQLGMQKRVEDHLADKVQTLLDHVLGAGQAVVRVTAQLNFERAERNVQKIDPDSQVTLEESIRKDETLGKTSGAAGVPGTSSNTADATVASTAGTSNSNSRKQSNTTSKYQYNTTTERIIAETGALKRLSVAVLVAPKLDPAAQEGKGATAPRSEQELKKLSDVVKSAVGYSPERKDVIQVDELPFSSELAALALTPPLAANPWLEFAQQHFNDALGLLAVAIVALVFWRMFSRLTQTQASLAQPATAEGRQPGADRDRTPVMSAESMEDELQSLVSQNSAQAAAAMRSLLHKTAP